MYVCRDQINIPFTLTPVKNAVLESKLAKKITSLSLKKTDFHKELFFLHHGLNLPFPIV